jgi:hypothetical protein
VISKLLIVLKILFTLVLVCEELSNILVVVTLLSIFVYVFDIAKEVEVWFALLLQELNLVLRVLESLAIELTSARFEFVNGFT